MITRRGVAFGSRSIVQNALKRYNRNTYRVWTGPPWAVSKLQFVSEFSTLSGGQTC